MNALKTILYMGSMHGFFTYYLPWRIGSHDPWGFDMGLLRWLAVPLWITGTLILLNCSLDMIRQGRGTPAHLDPPKALIVTGLYRHVRNPIYGGALLAQLGFILWYGSPLLNVYFMSFGLAFHILIIFIEEPLLRRMFGAGYHEYASQVPRWIPRL